MAKHSILPPSAAHRWLKCPPSARECEKYKDTSSEYAAQGTDAHALCEHKVEAALGRDSPDPTENLTWYDREMEDAATEYSNFVMEQVAEARKQCPDPAVLIEQRLDFSEWVPEGFGTGDCVIAADGTLQIIDFKYGVGVLVEADNNPQMMCYALGALSAFRHLYDIGTVRMTIFQPRRSHISTWEMSADDLYKWADDVLKPTARLAYNGEGEFNAGDHCQFCKAKANCRKRAEYNLELAKYDFEIPSSLDATEIAAILSRIDELTAWAGDIKDFALQQALSGTKYPGYKIVEGRSVRKYKSDDAVADIVTGAGYDPYERKVLGITAMTKLLGRKTFEDLLAGQIVKPQGKPALVPESDKRPAMNTAYDDFKE